MGGVLLIYFASVPVLGLNLAFHFYLMLWITMASAFNVAAGFSGYMPFGYVAFYGIGAFTTAILVQEAGLPGARGAAASPASPASCWRSLFAPTLRLSGIYFAHRQPGAGRHLPAGHHQHARGDHRRQFGLHLGSRAEPVHCFYVMMAVMLLALGTILWLSRSRLGKALRAIRDDAEPPT